jgi:hypothetical protein
VGVRLTRCPEPGWQRVVNRAVRGLEELIDAPQQIGDVVACEARAEFLERGPPLAECKPSRVVGALVERVEDAPGFLVGWLDEQRLPSDLRSQLKGLSDFNPQSEENMRGRLFVPQRAVGRRTAR